jgi:hypothetical protein
MRQCQKCQKGVGEAFGTFGTPSVSAFGVKTTLLRERRAKCPGAVPVLVCHDEVVVECDEDRGEETKRWLEQAMNEGMDVIMNNVGKTRVPVEVEPRIAKSWEQED